MNVELLFIVVLISTFTNLIGGVWLYDRLNADQWNAFISGIAFIQLILLGCAAVV
jgi:hypothetical protein